jgi:hypothetical protein
LIGQSDCSLGVCITNMHACMHGIIWHRKTAWNRKQMSLLFSYLSLQALIEKVRCRRRRRWCWFHIESLFIHFAYRYVCICVYWIVSRCYFACHALSKHIIIVIICFLRITYTQKRTTQRVSIKCLKVVNIFSTIKSKYVGFYIFFS